MYTYLPNILTLLRMIAGGVLWYLITIHSVGAALAVLTFGVVTDFYDGYLARRYRVETPTGAFLDPLADKILVLLAFGGLWQQKLVAWWIIAVIAGRDLLITWLRMWMLHRGTPLKTLWLAKSKTVIQFGALYLFIIGNAIVYGSLFDLGLTYKFTVYQGLHYLGMFTAGVTALTGLIYLPQLLRVRR